MEQESVEDPGEEAPMSKIRCEYPYIDQSTRTRMKVKDKVYPIG